MSSTHATCLRALLLVPAALVACAADLRAGEVTHTGRAEPPGAELSLWYTQAASEWETQALPIGNGRIGGMVFGGVECERIQLNEKTLWSGGPGEWDRYAGGNKADTTEALARVRELLAQKRFQEAGEAVRGLMGDKRAFGAYQTLGDVYLDFIDRPSIVELAASSENAPDEGKECAFDGAVSSKWFTRDSGPAEA
jgi:hypothetical protein